MEKGSWTNQELLPVSENPARRPGLPISGGVLALIAAGTFMLVRAEPFHPSRPNVADPKAVFGVETESVRARLWEDPFAAVARHLREEERGEAPRSPSFESLSSGEAREEVTVVGVMVPGGPYDEMAERRLRSRHATLSALGVQGYSPEDSEHVGYFQSGDFVVPYEWLRKDDEWLLLLWLDDDELRPGPLARIANLVTELKRASPVPIALKLLGPYGSTNLREMAEELGRGHRKELAGVHIYSPSATIADDLLPGADGGSLDNRFRFWTESEDSRFLRTTGTDQDLAEVLVEELRRRGVCSRREVNDKACDEDDELAHIALVSEWDTHYGRALPCAFISAVLGGIYPLTCFESSRQGVADDKLEGQLKRISRFSYLRGLDGQLPATSSETDVDRDSSREGKAVDSETVERPVGRRRLDYLRRLADQLQRRDAALRREGKGIEAIGVLGSDVYDKLLVLQALRKRFPRVLFFTTDLHAGLLHPSEYPTARNLIVAANFGLELAEDLQHGVPAFRDSYQTSLFFSVQLALDSSLETRNWMQPRIFEIARRGAFDLSVSAGEKEEETAGVHPPRADLLSKHPKVGLLMKLLLVIFPALAFGGLYSRTYRHMRPVEDEPADRLAAERLSTARAWFGLVLLIGATALSFLMFYQAPEGEPFALFEGISIWPSLYLRFFVGALSLYFLAAGWIAMCKSDDNLLRQFRIKPEDQRPSFRELLTRLRQRWEARRLSDAALRLTPPSIFNPSTWPTRNAPAPSTADDLLRSDHLLRTYRRRGGLVRRVLRVVPLWFVYVFLGILFLRTFGDLSVPYRGASSLWANFLVTRFFAVPALTFLILWVADATRLSVWLARELACCHTKWPKKTKRYFAQKLKLKGHLLEDWLNVVAIARHSAAVGRLVYYPVLVIVLMIASRAPYFDNWDFPVALCLVISLSLGLVLCCAVALRRSAERARTAAIKRYWTALIRAAGNKDTQSAEQIRLILDRVRNLREGAFGPISQQPWVRAVALLLSGSGSLALLDYFVWLN